MLQCLSEVALLTCVLPREINRPRLCHGRLFIYHVLFILVFPHQILETGSYQSISYDSKGENQGYDFSVAN